MRRPLIESVILAWGAILCASFMGTSGVRILYTTFVVLTGVFYIGAKKFLASQVLPDKVFWIKILVSLLICILALEIHTAAQAKTYSLETYSGACTLFGVVKEVNERSTKLVDVQITTRDNKQVSLDGVLLKHNWKEKSWWHDGDKVKVKGSLSTFESERNPGTFSPIKYYNSIGLSMYVENVNVSMYKESYSIFLHDHWKA